MAVIDPAMDTPSILTIVGLVMDASGIVTLFKYAPEKYPDPQSRAGFAIKKEVRDGWRKKQARRRCIANISLGVIVGGFALQAIAVVLRQL